MNKIFSKNALIVVLFASNAGLSTYVVSLKGGIRPVPVAAVAAVPQQPKGIVGTPLFKYENEMQYCYEDFLRKRAKEQTEPVELSLTQGEASRDEGVVHFHWSLAETGDLKGLKLVKSDFSDADFHGCITDILRKARLSPTPEKLGVLISHKFKFKRESVGQISFDSGGD